MRGIDVLLPERNTAFPEAMEEEHEGACRRSAPVPLTSPLLRCA